MIRAFHLHTSVYLLCTLIPSFTQDSAYHLASYNSFLKMHLAFLSTVCIATTKSMLLVVGFKGKITSLSNALWLSRQQHEPLKEYNVQCIIHVHLKKELCAIFLITINENVTDFLVQTRLPVQVIVSRPLITNCSFLACKRNAQLKSHKVHKRCHR